MVHQGAQLWEKEWGVKKAWVEPPETKILRRE